MKWQCEKCGLKLNVNTRRMYCECGAVAEVDPDSPATGVKQNAVRLKKKRRLGVGGFVKRALGCRAPQTSVFAVMDELGGDCKRQTEWLAEQLVAAATDDSSCGKLSLEAAVRIIHTSIERWTKQETERREQPKTVFTGDRPRVGFVTPTLNMGGAERWISILASNLDRERYEVQGMAVVHANTRQVPVADHVQVVDGPDSLDWIADRSDVLIAWGDCKLHLLPHDSYRGLILYSLQGPCEFTTGCVNRYDPYISHYVPVSEFARQSMTTDRPYTIISNGIDTSRLRTHLSRWEARERLGLRPEDIALGYFGRISHEKDCLSCVQAALELGPPYRPILIGGCPNSVAFIPRAREMCPDVLIHPFTESVGDVYAALDVFFLTSPSEGFSHSLAEAWYCGIPTVCTPVGGVPSLTEQWGEVAAVVPVEHSPIELAAATRRALSREHRPVVAKIQKIVADAHTERHMVASWERLIDSLLGITR